MSLRALDGDTDYHTDLALRAQAAKGTSAMFEMARFYGRLEKGRDYDRDSVFKAIREADNEAEAIDALMTALQTIAASSGTKRKWRKAAIAKSRSLYGETTVAAKALIDMSLA